MPAPIDGEALHVDDFPDGLVPYLGGQKPSSALAEAVMVVLGLLGFANILRAFPNVFAWSLGRRGSDLSVRDVMRMSDSWQAADEMRVPALIGVVVAAIGLAMVVRRRRPRAELVARGEAFVEVSLMRIWPRSRFVAVAVLGALGIAGLFAPDPGWVSLEAIATLYLALGLASVALAAAFAMLFLLLRSSRRHLERRLAISTGLTPDDVPYVAPDPR